MAKDTITQLLEKVASGKVSVKDARTALEDAALTEEQMDAAINHGVFNLAESGTVVSASLAPSGSSALTIFFFGWGIFWSLYWFGTMLYGLLNGSAWDQQLLSYHLAMGTSTLIMMGIVYMKWVLPNTIIVKHSQNKYVPEHQKDWREYNW
ncbi:MAG: hypothetical protein L7S49_02085 [Candidatus Poseidoniaceae archaeon]|nr:hypothetical protein [Euryarchaeota archaeon]MCH1526982.1 hypothetical protein [Candidatus Poseidoniaceae archaeon]|tara:strand:+ start:1972 stop:2424 length:453 start_codon:yes stop_codon:yes gene_type:complete